MYRLHSKLFYEMKNTSNNNNNSIMIAITKTISTQPYNTNNWIKGREKKMLN